ncbi:hypothetical protein MOUN0_F05094 [Monosporozyma unispora]|nr:hypothetical protein C6P44_002812 [Kazachstania unispora]
MGLAQLNSNNIINNNSTPNLTLLNRQSLTSSSSATSDRRPISQSDSQIDSMVLHDLNPTGGKSLQQQSYFQGWDSMDWDSKDHQSTFPSPPLSPKIRPYQSERLSSSSTNSPYYKLYQGIICVPNWRKGQTIRNYRLNTRKFLWRYRIFNDNNINNTSNTSNTIIYNSNNYYYSPRQSHYLRKEGGNDGLRKLLLKQHYGKDIEYHRRSKSKSQSPYHHRIGTASSPPPTIASIGLVTEAPQYVPMISWKKLPDYCPDVNTLPHSTNNRCLKVEWKGSPLNLSHDPLKFELHPAELVLASILRLPCDLYLDSKRRLFLEKVCKLQNRLPFRRTDAQKACRIDVNKASRLYSAFEKVGWLNDSNFMKYLK